MLADKSRATLRRALLGATSIAAALGAASAAYAQAGPTMSEHSPGIIVNNNLDPNTPAPGGALDPTGITVGLATGVTGVGQMTVRPNPATTGLSVCSGTLINPRTVIFAAHCVNTRPASAYGPNGTANGLNPNGTPIAFGFGANNTPAVRQWLGLASAPGGTDANPALINQTNQARALFAVEEVWWDPRSLQSSLGPSFGFLEADVAIATLDTPASGIPTWAMLFSPLTSPAHVTIAGYGVNGTSATAQGPGGPCGNCSTLGGIDFRRRAAENVVSLLSLDDIDDWLFGENSDLPQTLYQADFDDPAGEVGFNFDLFNGAALPREGTTSGGDSGGPLIVDQRFGRAVVAAVLSGGSRYFDQQRFSTYGTSNFYQPLFLFWDVIVANNPYVYAGNKTGTGAWEDPGHWFQLMDPSYLVERDGDLVNDTPDTPALGVTGETVKFGEICFLDDCTDAADDDTATDAPAGSGEGLFVPGGPGSEDFVPDNVTSNPRNGVRGRYYDVILAAAGATTLSSAKTVDRLTIDGPTLLDVQSGGNLTVLTEFTQWVGATNVDGTLKSRDALIATGILSGSGVIDPTFLTIGSALVAVGGLDRVETLEVKGDVVLTDGSVLLYEAARSGADKLIVTGDTLNTGIASLDGTIVFAKGKGAAPRDGQVFELITAAGGVDGTFDTAASLIGVLRPELTYGPNNVTATLRAGSFADFVHGADAVVAAFASALDAIRANGYDSLYNLYGSIDVMARDQLSATLSGLNPVIVGETRSLHDRQSKVMLNAIGDRLSMLGSKSLGGSLSIVGQPYALVALGTESGVPAEASLAQGLQPAQMSFQRLPKGMSGFISGGFSAAAASYGDAGQSTGQRSWHIGMGLEMEVAENATLGTAFGYSNGYSLPGANLDRTDSRMTQAAVYGSYRFGGGAYIAGIAVAEKSRAAIDRQASTGEMMFDLAGATTASRYAVEAEAGINLDVGRQLTLTPRAGLSYASYSFGGYRETGGELALQIDDLQVQRLEARIGAKLAGSMSLGEGWSVVPQLQADYVHSLSGADDGMEVRFAVAPEQAFLLPLAGGDRSWAQVRGGLRLTNGPVEFGAGLESSLGRSDYQDERAIADFTFRF